MEPDYPWQCLICGSSNAASSVACAQCGFPARASGRAIAEAKAGHEREALPRASAVVARRDAFEGFARDIAPLSFWRKAMATLGLGMACTGAVVLKAAWSIAAAGGAILGIAGGLALVALACADLPRQPSE